MLTGAIDEEVRGGALTRVGAKDAEEPMRAADSSEMSFMPIGGSGKRSTRRKNVLQALGLRLVSAYVK